MVVDKSPYNRIKYKGYLLRGRWLCLKQRNAEIDIIKFAASIIIMLFHTYLFFPQVKIVVNGHLCVEIFFIITGYYLARSASFADAGQPSGASDIIFIEKKLKGFFPQYLLCITASFILLLCFGMVLNWQGAPERILSDVFLLEIEGYGFFIDGPMWYLSAMLLVCFILWPFLVRFREFFCNVASPLISAFGYGYILKINGDLHSPTKWLGFVYIGTIRAFAGVCLGCIIFEMAGRLSAIEMSENSEKRFTALHIILTVVLMISVILSITKTNDFGIVILIFIVLLTSFCSHNKVASSFNEKISNYLGRLSLFIYLVHFPIAMIIAAKKDWFDSVFSRVFSGEMDYIIIAIYSLIVVIYAVMVMLFFDKIKVWAGQIKHRKEGNS